MAHASFLEEVIKTQKVIQAETISQMQIVLGIGSMDWFVEYEVRVSRISLLVTGLGVGMVLVETYNAWQSGELDNSLE